MKKYIILMTLLSLGLLSTNSNAALVGSAFNYQGELINNGSPANGDYDIEVTLFKVATGGPPKGNVSISAVPVVNGLFNIELDFGDMVYIENDQWYLEIQVKATGDLTYETLSPRNKLNAVPYAVQADFLAPGGASSGDILKFNGTNWAPSASGGSSPWAKSGTTLTSPGKVGVGEPTPSAQLHVTNNTSQISLLKVDDVSNTRMVVQATGQTGIGTAGPSDRLHIRSETGENALRVQVGTQTKLRVFENGGTALGANSTSTPENGLYVAGDVKQHTDSNGMVKYMFRANCKLTPTIMQEYNATNVVGTASITRNSKGNCTIALPSAIFPNFLSVSPVHAISGDNRIASCANFLAGVVCQVSVGSTGADVDGIFDVLVF